MNRSSIQKNKFIPDLTISSRSSFNYKGYSTLQKLKPLRDQKTLLGQSIMPSIHQNDHSLISEDSEINKIRRHISELLFKDKQKDEWRLYISKTDLIQKNARFQEIEIFLLRIIQQNYLKLSTIKKHNKNEDISFLEQKSCIKKLKQKFCESQSLVKQSSYIQKRSQIKFKQQFSKINSKLKQEEYIVNNLNLQNTILEKKIQIYQQKVLQKLQISEQNRLQFKQKQEKENNQTYSLIKQKTKYQNQAQLRRIQFETLTREYISLGKQYNETKNELKILNQKMFILKQKVIEYEQLKKYRQLWLMLNQQFLFLKKQYMNLKQEKNQYIKRVEHLREKNKQLIKSIHMKTHLNPDQQEDKHELDYIMKSFQQWLKVFRLPRVYPNIAQNQRMPFLEQNKLEGIKPIIQDDELNYKLLKPNFYAFFESYENNILSEKVFAQYRTLERDFYLKMRGVFDSMYNQFLFSSHRQWLNFPEFAIGFLEKYEINQNTRLPQYRKKQTKSEQKINFLIDLFNKKIANTWQCEVFRCFLLEEYNLDEIFFYLDCRNQLHKGPALKSGLGCSDPVIYVKINRVLQLVTNRLIKYDYTIIEKIKSMLHLRKKMKNGNYLVDGYFALKVLLQVYSIEKIKSERIFKQSFNLRFTNKISFVEYRQFMAKNFKFLSEGQIYALYRQIYFISSGKITYKTIHYICSSRGLFIPLINNNRHTSNITKPLSEDIFILNLLNQMNKLDLEADECGIQSMRQCQASLSQLLTEFTWFKSNKSFFFIKLINEIFKVIKLKMYIDWQASNLQNNQLTDQNIINMLNILLIIINDSNQSFNILNKHKEKIEKSLRMISRNFKIRIQQTFQQFKEKQLGQLYNREGN